MGYTFEPIDRDTPTMFPASVQHYIAQKHLARHVVEIVEMLDVRLIENAYSGRGSKAYHPRMLLSLLIYGYSQGIFSSRKLERASMELIPMRFICGNLSPDHDTIATFRRRFIEEIKPLFKQVLTICRKMGHLKAGHVSLDGTKIKADASKHRAMSWEGATRLEKRLEEEVDELLRLAEEADQADSAAHPEDVSIPEELERREERLKFIREAKTKIEARAKERHEEEQAEYEAKLEARRKMEEESGRKLPGFPPRPPVGGVRPTDQVNLTDEESRIMPVSSGGFDQAYNAQAAVDIDSRIIVATLVTQAPNDKEQIEPMLEEIGSLSEVIEPPKSILADSGYYSEGNVRLCVERKVTPYIAHMREKHHRSVRDLLRAASERPPEDEEVDRQRSNDPVKAMKHRMQTKEGRALYAHRKSTIEPVFGIVKRVLGFRQFTLRGLKKAEGEWNLVCMAMNIKRMHALKA
jgi:transposase